ncbi:uncharacterized protein LACBIDRAFT_323179 [Laccaria bicolor S238N-H82]|uniref:Predicted protein n=1 Tax=Laccaria bicolor (strain S238N-H82 / ATCC MYA-4686) TaxID=486041 RepID=B0CZD5_LACBS|nr:uncharacterized protein LACBIDRAFT_323179 [Laccaria bicolor S238N-H82]EDR12129.1 predicted protein [Laccaria bicolor S238N-H82]|eukprot:XP_001876393.1 predicted protein [Laccaria bicolor S238N-H82]
MGNRLHTVALKAAVPTRCAESTVVAYVTTSLDYLFLTLFQTDPRRTRRGSCGRPASTSPKPRFFVPSEDGHHREYVAPSDMRLEMISGGPGEVDVRVSDHRLTVLATSSSSRAIFLIKDGLPRTCAYNDLRLGALTTWLRTIPT